MQEQRFDKNNGAEVLMSWDVDEYTRHDRGPMWYVVAAIIGTGLIIFALITANFLFAVIILMFGVISFVLHLREPSKIDVAITNLGIALSDSFISYKDIRDFSIVFNPPAVKLIYIDFKSSFKPLLAIPLENIDPNDAREILLQYVKENLSRTEETFTDLICRVYKI